MKKILILNNNLDDLYSFRIELIEKLDEKYKVVVSTPKNEKECHLQHFIALGVDLEFLDFNRRGKNPIGDLALMINYYKLIKKIDPDIVLTYTIRPNIYGTLMANVLNKPVIINISGLGTAFYKKRFKYFAMFLYKIVCNKARYVFFQNENNLSFFLTNNLVNKGKTKLIPGSGVNIVKFIPIQKVEEDRITRFLYIGRIMKEKGIEEYLELAKIINLKYSYVEFQILGYYEEEKYEVIINNSREVIYLGISNDVRNEIKEVDCIINPTYHEGMSNVLLEGGAMGKPLIASNIPGCKEAIDDGVNGYLFEPKNIKQLEEKVEKFLNLSKADKEEMGRNSTMKISQEFDRNSIIGEYTKSINDALHQ